ncbi:MAG: prepilin-type N-terminal cleavage/methylation domain-containing protein [Candidatus Riflebacteria bacterium]|nr:prepilin-type N-terminal cleavage/methylation domain-containing protein [Candidatus Riflebacteria bacterium]
MRSRGVRSGFTLMEVLIAVAIFSMLLVVLYQSYVGVTRIVARCQTGFAPIREGLKVQKVLRRILASASASRQRNAKATFSGDDRRLSFTTLNRQGVEPDHPCPIAYVRIEHDSEDGLAVVSHPTYFLTDKVDPAKGQRLQFPLIRSLKLQYWDTNGWIRDWEATKKGSLPARVRVELKAEGEGSGPIAFAFDVALPIQSDLPITGGVPFGQGPLPGPGQPGVPGQGGLPAPGPVPAPYPAPTGPNPGRSGGG